MDGKWPKYGRIKTLPESEAAAEATLTAALMVPIPGSAGPSRLLL